MERKRRSWNRKIAGKQRELSKSKDTLSQIPRMNGYENALEVKNAYKTAKRELGQGTETAECMGSGNESRRKKMYLVIRANRPEQTKKRSIHGRLEEKETRSSTATVERAKTEL